jgi:hypothetical protein
MLRLDAAVFTVISEEEEEEDVHITFEKTRYEVSTMVPNWEIAGCQRLKGFVTYCK